MLRALITAIAMTVVVIMVGVPLVVVGLVHPSRRLVAASSRLWAKVILYLAGVRLTVEGKEHIADAAPRFFMGNHQSALDIPILITALDGNVRFMAKDTLFRIPLFGWVLRRYGYAPVNRNNARATLQTLERMLDRIRQYPVSFAVFPEGTRSRDGRLLAFRRGTMKIGQRSGLPIVPFAVDGSVAVHCRDRFRATPGPVKLSFSKPIPAEQVAAMSPNELQALVVRTVAGMLGQWYEATTPEHAPCVAAEGA